MLFLMKSPNYAGKDLSCKNEKIRMDIIAIVEDIYTAEVKVNNVTIGDGKTYGRFYNAPLKPETIYKIYCRVVITATDGVRACNTTIL